MIGATPANEIDTIKKAFDDNLTQDEQNNIPHFYAVGGLDYDKMSFKHKIMMKGLLIVLKNKQPERYNIISKSFDARDFRYLNDLVKYVNEM
ncbi:hypothetical protein [Intestinibacter bartlettii]|uniref:Uncharacterized protein n=1 Tax=Intestinibacter bartlettii TaxID=261299 RepID=A0ABS6DT78_9FIRM|nr:hypothetical protein [Intestinibacter bartlettii]MBU5334887.1 hypothetical protein [Intestinibacter bartlettii]MDO5010359.1 hypothetical protein [Intestinibacter bartlettii]